MISGSDERKRWTMRPRSEGMTLLEVVIALTIFSLGIGFLVKGDAVSYHYRAKNEARQQMMFAAAGQMEKLIEVGSTDPDVTIGGVHYIITGGVVSEPDENTSDNPAHLSKVHVSIVREGGSPEDTVTLYGYRVKR